ncbi:hypothetical protein [Streptomyces sp. NPDC059009]|uniref:hypothetical protein n=1 Tax=Streptomyces sp. NPDC059009 TaxID=3346694 RepID=UPI0036918ABD
MSISRTAVAIGAALSAALVLSACGSDDGGNSGQGDGGSEATAPEAKVLAKVPMAKVSELTGAMGMWTTDKNFVKTELKKIVGYPLAGGKQQWEVPLAGEVCWSSERPSKDGKVAVLFQNDKESTPTCTEVGVVDINKGKLLWQKEAKDSYGSAQSFDEVSLGGGTVAAAGTSGAASWSVGGAPQWKQDSDTKCPDQGYASEGEKLVAVRDCGSTDRPALEVQTVNPKNRTATSSYKLPQGTKYAHVVSTDPLVVAVDDGKSQGGSGISSLLSIDDGAAQGKLLSTISAKGGKHGKYEAECPSTNVSGCTQITVDKKTNTLFVGTSDPVSASSDADNDIVAISLKTGKRVGMTQGSESGRMAPVGVDEGGKVIVYQESSVASEEGGAVWSIDPATYKKTKLMQNPSSTYEMESRFETDRRVLYAGERLYLGADHESEPSTVYKTPQPIAAIFGTK